MKYLLLGILASIAFFFLSMLQMRAWLYVFRKELSKYLEKYLLAQSQKAKEAKEPNINKN